MQFNEETQHYDYIRIDKHNRYIWIYDKDSNEITKYYNTIIDIWWKRQTPRDFI